MSRSRSSQGLKKSNTSKENSQKGRGPSKGYANKRSTPDTAASRSRTASRNAAGTSSSHSGFIDERTRRDIWGVVIGVVALALLITVSLESDAVITSFLSDALTYALGIGAYLLPILLLCIAVSFLVRSGSVLVPSRVVVGLLLIFFCTLPLFALYGTDVSSSDLKTLFSENNLISGGGYVGSGIAWVGLTLFGKAITCVVLVGLIIVGLVIIGLSFTKIFDRIRDAKYSASGENKPDQTDIKEPPPYARVRRSFATGIHSFADNSSEDHLSPNTDTKVLSSEKESVSFSTRRIDPSHTVALEGSDTSLTRKLGRAARHSEAQSTRVLDGGSSSSKSRSAQKLRIEAPLAMPKPQEGFLLPSFSLLKTTSARKSSSASSKDLSENASLLQETLEDFGINARVVGWVAGPSVTLFKVDLPAGVRVSRVTALNDDIALALAAPGVRIFAPIPDTNYVGIEVPNRIRETVLLGDVLKSAPSGPMQIAIGKDVEGNSIIADLSKMPHLLIGGTTGSGKSVCINAMIMSILMRATPSEVRFIMVDPKRVEFSPYNGIPHLYVPVVTEAKEAASALSWGVAEMERRLKLFSKIGAKNIGQFNAKAQAEEIARTKAEEKGGSIPPLEIGPQLPYIVIIIDELADLMMSVGKEVEYSISRIAQLARAAGIHLIVATQRPSTNVVTGLIKANITNRIAFNVASGIDSRVVLDVAGAENLIGNGDLLFSKPEYPKPQRIQGCYVSEDEIYNVVDHLKDQGEPEYHSEILKTNLITLGDSSPDGTASGSVSDDPLVWEAADIVVSSGFGSTSNIQRRLKVGYSRAGRIMDMLEAKGVVGPPNGSKPREVLVDALELETLKAFEANDEA